MKIKSLILAAGLFMTATAAFAQEEETAWHPNWFVGLQGGVQAKPLDGNLKELMTPHFGIQAGRYFDKVTGMRLQLLGYEGKAKMLDEALSPLAGQYTKYKTWSAKWDVLFNVTNIISPNRTKQNFNWIMFLGAGASGVWDTPSYSDNFTVYAGLGTQVEYLFTKNFGVNLELQFNPKYLTLNDMNNGNHFQGVALVGLTYHFGHKKVVAPVAAPTTTVNVYDQAEAEAEAARAAAKKAEAERLARAEAAKKAAETNAAKVVKPAPEEPLKETFFYNIRKSDPDPETILNRVAEWCKKYPNKKVSVEGYADAGTGTAAINKKYAKQRAQKVADQLIKKGVDASRIEVSSYGDTVQPFSENDRNRCVIVVGK